MKKKDPLKSITLKELKKNFYMELGNLEKYPIGSKKYDKALKGIALITEIMKRKKGKAYAKKYLKKVI